MRTPRLAVSLLVVCAGLATEAATAGSYDFETGLMLGYSSTDAVNVLGVVGGNPVPGAGLGFSSSDSDTIEVFGTWYYSGATDEKGPKSQAAFLSRASSLEVAYAYDDASSSFSSTGTIAPLPITPPVSSSTSAKTNALTLRARHVWQGSGWYALGSIGRLEADFVSVAPPGRISGDVSGTAYSAGFGKYLGDATAVDLSVVRTDQDGNDTTAVAVFLKHIGSFGASWQYGADLGIASSDGPGDEQTYQLRFSLFPVQEFEFGGGVRRREFEFGDENSYEAFASWFPSDRVELRARYAVNDIGSFATTEYDSDEFGVGLNIRF